MYRSRSTIAGFFLVVMLLPVCWFTALRLHQEIVRYEMLERMEQAGLETITIPVRNLVWYKKDKEILVNNQLFDVKSIRILHGMAEIKGLFDQKESQIRKALSETGDHQTGKSAGKFIELLLLHRFHSIQTGPAPEVLNQVHIFPLKTAYTAPFRDHQTPPPRL